MWAGRISGPPTAVYGGVMFAWHEDRAGVRRVLTSREGGVSEGPYAGLNLGSHVGDRPEHVSENRRRLADAIGAPVAYMDQCHGTAVEVLEAVPSQPPRADALVTARPGLALAALVADCVPVLLADPGAGVVAAVHAGRPGMAAGVVLRALDAMRDLGAREIDAVVGPSVCGRCYEVPAAMREDVAAASPVSAAVSWTGTAALDVASGVVDQLTRGGAEVRWLPGCAREDPTLYSHRRDGTTGRFAGLVLLGSA